MFWKWFWKGLSALLVLSTFVGGGIAIYRAGYIDGMAVGMFTSLPGEQVIKPNLGPYHVTLLLLPLMGLFLLFVFPLILFAGFRHFTYHWMGNKVHPSNPDEFRKRWKTMHYRHPYPGHWWNANNQDREKSTTSDELNDQQADTDENK